MSESYQSHASSASAHNLTPIVVERWPSERPLFIVAVVAASIIWLVLLITVVGLVYVGMVVLFVALMRLMLVGQLRGNAVRLGPSQFPELYATVDNLARRMGMLTPEVYLMQAGGSLNAFATRFLKSNFVVLFSDLLAACGDNTAARDMIIAHELGHIKCGHVRWPYFLLPAGFVPFLAPALSRAREYTCDRYGLAGAGDKDGAALGLTILASGGVYASRVNRAELVRQRETMVRSALMTLVEWLGTHPPLSKRIGEVDPSAAGNVRVTGSRRGLAAAVVFGIPFVFLVIGWQVKGSKAFSDFRAAMDSTVADEPHVVPPDAEQRARADVARIAEFVEQERKSGTVPWNLAQLKQRMIAQGYRTEFPMDPFDGFDYGYDQRGGDFMIWSIGADQESWTGDDIRYDSRIGQVLPATAGTTPKQ